MSLLDLFCAVDDFWLAFAQTWHTAQLHAGARRRKRAGFLAKSEVMTSLISVHQSHYRPCKAYSTQYVCVYLRGAFPTLVSYSRFVDLIPSVLVPLAAYLETCRGPCTGISFVDAPPWPSASIHASTSTASLLVWPHGGRTRWAGFSASSCTCASISMASCWPGG